MSKKTKNITDFTLDDFLREDQKTEERQKYLINGMEKSGFLISEKSAFLPGKDEGKLKPREMTAKNIFLAATTRKNIIQKEDKKLKQDLDDLTSYPLSSKSSEEKGTYLQNILRNMNDASGNTIGNIDRKRKYEAIIDILILEYKYGLDWHNFLEKRQSKSGSKRSGEEALDAPSIALGRLNKTLNKQDDMAGFVNEQGDDDDDGFVNEQGDDDNGDDGFVNEEEIKEAISCNENDYKCNVDQVCDLEQQKCISKSNINIAKPGFRSVSVDGKTFYGSEQTLKKLRKCDVDKPCDDDKYCDLDNYKCVNKGENKDLYYFIELDGKKFYGSNEALKQLNGYCNFDKACPDNQKCVIEENRCYPADSQTNIMYNNSHEYMRDGVTRKTIAPWYSKLPGKPQEEAKKSYSRLKEMKDNFIKLSSNSVSSSSAQKPNVVSEQKQAVEERRKQYIADATKVPPILETGQMMVQTSEQRSRQSKISQSQVQAVITNIVTKSSQPIAELGDIQKQVLSCLGL